MPPKVWFITAASKAFGRVWAEAALARGDQVVATGRNTAPLARLATRYGDNVLPMRLDASDKAAVDAALARALERFGRLDVVVDSKGSSSTRCVAQAALPILREQGSGHIVLVCSVDGVHPLPALRDSGVGVTLVELTGHDTTGQPMLDLVDLEEPPLRVLLGA